MEHHMNNQNGHHDSAHKSNHLDANDPATLANPANSNNLNQTFNFYNFDNFSKTIES